MINRARKLQAKFARHALPSATQTTSVKANPRGSGRTFYLGDTSNQRQQRAPSRNEVTVAVHAQGTLCCIVLSRAPRPFLALRSPARGVRFWLTSPSPRARAPHSRAAQPVFAVAFCATKVSVRQATSYSWVMRQGDVSQWRALRQSWLRQARSATGAGDRMQTRGRLQCLDFVDRFLGGCLFSSLEVPADSEAMQPTVHSPRRGAGPVLEPTYSKIFEVARARGCHEIWQPFVGENLSCYQQAPKGTHARGFEPRGAPATGWMMILWRAGPGNSGQS
jgi:hypothetical protein